MPVNQQQDHIKNLPPSTGGVGRVCIFGGTFDPIHNAHIALAEACREQLGLDEVWFLVTPQNPWKQGNTLSPDADRLHMAQLAVEGHDGLIASDYEFHLEKPTYTYLTLRHLREDYPHKEFILLIGGDNWAAFNHWSHFEEILQHHAIAVYPRNLPQPLQRRGEAKPTRASASVTQEADSSFAPNPNGSITPPLEGQGMVIHAPLLPISSTSIRQRVAKHEPIDDVVHPAVKEYILKNHLYEEV